MSTLVAVIVLTSHVFVFFSPSRRFYGSLVSEINHRRKNILSEYSVTEIISIRLFMEVNVYLCMREINVVLYMYSETYVSRGVKHPLHAS